MALIRVTGEEASSFLQGQLSNDLRTLTPQRAQLSSYNSPKGRMLAVLQVVKREDDSILLVLPRDLLEPITRRLRMFVLRSKVQLADAGDALAVLGVCGAGAEAVLAAAGLALPIETWASAETRGISVIRQPGSETGFLLIGAPAFIENLETASDETWRLRQILAGVPTVYPLTSDHFVAQMANLDLLGGISFEKGCYTGQEIVARLHYLGNLKRRMFLSGGDGASPEPGTAVFQTGESQPVGEVVDAVANPAGGFAASMVLQLAHADSASLRLSSPEGEALTKPMPYAARIISASDPVHQS